MTKQTLVTLGLLAVLSGTAGSRPASALPHDGSLADPDIRYIGRWDKSSPAEYHSYWAAPYLRVGFTGTSVKIRLAQPTTLNVSIDGAAPIKLNAADGASLCPAPLAPGQHTLLVGGNAQNEEVRFQGLTLDPGAATFALPARPIIEFIGDSITAVGGPANYAWLTGEALGCDHTQIAFSGVALTSGFGCSTKVGQDTQYFCMKNYNHMEDMPQVPWDFSYSPQVVVINLGQNDQCGAEPAETMTASYVGFIENIRAKLPKAQIVALRTFGGPYAASIQQAAETVSAKGDTRVHYIDTTSWLEAGDFGDGIHPTAAGNIKVAGRLAPLLRPLLVSVERKKKMTETLPKRCDVPVEKTWNVESVFPSADAWETEFVRVGGLLNGFAEYAGHLGDSAATLAAALARRTEVGMAVRKLGLYASMLRSGDTGDQAAAALSSRAGGLGARYASATAFYEPELLAIDPALLTRWTADTPALALYAHYFNTLARRRDHVRSEEVEALLAQVSEPLAALGTASGSLTDADLKFTPVTDAEGVPHEVAQGTIADLLRHPDQAVRKAAWESYADGHLSVKNTLAACLSGRVKQSVFQSRARRYPSALEASLLPNAIPREVFDTLLSTFQANLPIWHRYWRLLKKGLGVETLYCCDLPADTVPAPMPKSEPPISFAEATEIICAGMAPLGAEYVDAMRQGLSKDRWVDGVPNIGKGSGAFSSGMPGTYPFIMMNFRDDLFSVSTLAHELGHSMHSYLTWQNQPPIYSGYSLFVAEVASNFDQALVRGHLLDTLSDRDSVLAIIEEAISNFHRYLFVMPTLARFELDCHEKIERGEALTADGMSATLAGFFREGYGGEVEVDEARLGITWAEFRHLYAPFYVYQYATGISAANALAEDVRTEGAPAAERYLTFLKAGGSLYPLDALQLAGIDMTSPEPIQRAFGVLSKMVDRLAEIVGE